MPNATQVTTLLATAQDQATIRVLSLGADTTWSNERCPHCGHGHALVVAAQLDGNYNQGPNQTAWLRCVACQAGYVRQFGVVHPGGKPLRTPDGVPEDESTIWEEARSCLGIGAFTASVMLCRKLLLHIAVSHGLAEQDAKGFAPGFAECAKYLRDQGLVTERMMPWVDRIKDIGNEANHKLTPITAAQALDVGTFTEQLLILAYELDARMDSSSSV